MAQITSALLASMLLGSGLGGIGAFCPADATSHGVQCAHTVDEGAASVSTGVPHVMSCCTIGGDGGSSTDEPAQAGSTLLPGLATLSPLPMAILTGAIRIGVVPGRGAAAPPVPRYLSNCSLLL